MSLLDWIVLFGALLFIVIYGVWKTRGSKNIESYLLGNKSMKWWTIGLSIMATQASAITFLSTPGQAYEDGMRFIQTYLGLPIAMIVLSIFFIPLFFKLKVYTAYEFLEQRFDLKTRTLTSFLFLIQRGLAAGITIYAPSIILSTILDWPLIITNLIIGILVIIYTVSGGTRAVSQTQKQQMAVMMGGMIIAFILIIAALPKNVSTTDALHIAGKMDKLNLINFSFNIADRYNFWSGIIGGFFVAMAYFGTDQSQVARYLSGKSIKEIRLGLLFNGLFKLPMQFLILLVGVMVFVFYQFTMPPLFFNQSERNKVSQSAYEQSFSELEKIHQQNFIEKKKATEELIDAIKQKDQSNIQTQTHELKKYHESEKELKHQAAQIIQKVDPDAETNDTDYVFISFIINYLPHGIIGLLLAVIFSAAMSSTASELNALASTTTVDLYKRSIKKEASEKHYLNVSKWLTLFWGILAILFATFAQLLDNLIEAVNILGSLFYGTILGIFLVAFFIKWVRGNAIFMAALLGESLVILSYFTFKDQIGYLWHNVIGCLLTILLSLIIQTLLPKTISNNN